jgi:dCMP deaminase
MATAALSSYRSKDPVHPTGACLVDEHKRIIGTGYNGFPRGCSDDVLPWTTAASTDQEGGSETRWLHSKTPYEVKAEVNAILNRCVPDCKGASLYTLRFPCNECAKVIVQSRIKEVVYLSESSDTTDPTSGGLDSMDDKTRASVRIFASAGVTTRPYRPVRKRFELNFLEKMGPQEEQICEESVNTKKRPSTTSADALQYRDLLLREADYDPLAVGPTKRVDALQWDDYFLAMAFLTAQRSKDPNTQVGACIVDSHHHIVGLGYNGMPHGCSDDELPWAREADSFYDKK